MYQNVGKNTKMPSPRAIKRIIYNLKDYMFPECEMDDRLCRPKFANFKKTKIRRELTREIKRCFYVSQICVESKKFVGDGAKNATLARQITDEFLSALPSLAKLCAMDARATIMGDPSAECEKIVAATFPGFFAIMVYRLAHFFYERKVPYLPRIMTENAHSHTGIDINAGAKIGKNFFIDHGTGVVIGETAEIGDNCRVYQGVTIGALSLRYDDSDRHSKRHPTILNNVTIYANATILGGKTVIGDNCVIGGNAFIIRSVESDTKIAVEPTLPKISR